MVVIHSSFVHNVCNEPSARACAARVTVVGPSVCVCVMVVFIHSSFVYNVCYEPSARACAARVTVVGPSVCVCNGGVHPLLICI